MPARIHCERGSAMVTSLLLVTLMLMVGMTTIAYVDTQHRESGRERQRESTFQLSEGVMNSQIFLLSREWPATKQREYPVQCDRSLAANPRCPDEAVLLSSFKGADYRQGIQWTTEIRDNAGAAAQNYYSDEAVRQQERWDANGDTYMWVRAQGILPNGRQRVIVALVRAELLTTVFPRHAVVAGRINITQNGNHSYIYSTDIETGEAGTVVVRCTPVSSQSCVSSNSKKPWISPATPSSQPNLKPALTPETIQLLRENAIANGTYYAAGVCPSNSQLSGELVFLENPTGCVFGESGSVWNSRDKPGVIVVGSGQFYLNHGTYYGLLYHANGSDGVGTPQLAGQAAVVLKSNSAVVGQVVIDGTGELEAGNNNAGPGLPGNIVYMGKVRNNLKQFGTAGIVQNSFREIQTARN